MQDIQSMLPYIDIAFHCKLLSLKQSAMQYVVNSCPFLPDCWRWHVWV